MIGRLKGLLTPTTGPGQLLKIASTFNLLPERADLVIRGLERAPSPKSISLGADWFKNLDLFAHGAGCIAVGLFDVLVDDMSVDEIIGLTNADFELLTEGMPLQPFLVSALITAHAEYVSGGPLTEQVVNGTLPPEGLVTQSLLTPIMEASKEKVATTTSSKPLFRRLISTKQDQPSNTAQPTEI